MTKRRGTDHPLVETSPNGAPIDRQDRAPDPSPALADTDPPWPVEHPLHAAALASREQLAASHADSTRRAYRADWAAFQSWCTAADRCALPANDDTLRLYFGARHALRPASLQRAYAAIRLAHRHAGLGFHPEDRPQATRALRGHARLNRHVPVASQDAATGTVVRAMVDALDLDSTLGLRNRALLLVGFDSGLRRSELVAIDVEHLDAVGEYRTIRKPASKTNPTGKLDYVAIKRRPDNPYCPVAALDAWIAHARITAGAVFRSTTPSSGQPVPSARRLSDRAVARITNAAAKAAGLDGKYAAHSLRRGVITTLFAQGVRAERVQAHVGHRALATTLAYNATGDAIQRHQSGALDALTSMHVDRAEDVIDAALQADAIDPVPTERIIDE